MFTGVRLKEKVKFCGIRMRGIAHNHRLAIAYILAHGELPLHEIVLNVDLPENLVAHHIGIMERTGWVMKRKSGREVYYRLIDRGFFTLMQLVVESPFYRETLMKRLK